MKFESRTIIARSTGRIMQGLVYLMPRRTHGGDVALRYLLDPDEFDLVAQLPAADRAHLLAVYRRLQRLGCVDADVLKAGLLHDVGKVDGNVHVRLLHRSVAVLLRATAPALFDRLAKPSGRSWRRAFHLVQAHPSLGAWRARDAGCNERVCWLIEHHHDPGGHEDNGLKLLQQADEG